MSDIRGTSLAVGFGLGAVAGAAGWLWLQRGLEVGAVVFWPAASLAAACFQFVLVHPRDASPSLMTLLWVPLLAISGLLLAAGSCVGFLGTGAFMAHSPVPASTQARAMTLLLLAAIGAVWTAGAGLLFVVEFVRNVLHRAATPNEPD